MEVKFCCKPQGPYVRGRTGERKCRSVAPAVNPLLSPRSPHHLAAAAAAAIAFSAARRSLATSLSHHLLTRRPHPSLSHLVPSHHDPSSSSSSAPPNPTQRPAPFPSGDLRRPSRSQNLPFPHPIPFPFCARRSFSTSSPPPDGVIDAVARLISDAASSVVAEFPSPFSEEVSAAAADSFLPVAAVQHLIDAVHSITGLNWWASIALTMLLVRTATIPLLVRQIKAENRLSALKPEIMAFIKEGDTGDPQSRQESRKKFFELLKRHDVSPLTPFKLLFIQGPIILSFSCAIRNMIEKVPSLKGGGAHWFTDLTTPDELYILPVLTSMTMAVQELNLKARIEGDPTPLQKVAKNTNRALAVLIIPLSMSLCKAHFFWWVPWSMFTLAYRFAIRRPAVRHYFGLPHLVPRPAPAPAPAQVPALTSPDLSEGPESMPAVDSPPAAKGSEQSSCEPNDGTVDVEKKRRTPRVIINRVRSDCSSSDIQ